MPTLEEVNIEIARRKARRAAEPRTPDGTPGVSLSRQMPATPMVSTDWGDTLPDAASVAPAAQQPSLSVDEPSSWARNATIEDLPAIGNPTAIYQRERQQTLDAIAAHTGGIPGKILSPFEKFQQGDPDAIRNAQREFGEWQAAGGDRKAASEKREFLQYNPNARQIINEAFGSAEEAEKLLAKIDNDYQTKLPAWEADVKQQVQQDADQARQWESSTPHLAGFPETGYVSQQIAGVRRDYTPQEQKDFTTAKRVLERSVYAYKTQSALEQEAEEMHGKGDAWYERFGHGIKPRTATDAASFGWAETTDLNRIAQINEKASQDQQLTAGEKALAQAYVIGLDAQARLQYLGGVTSWEGAGKSLGDNAPFLMEMALTGGFGTAASTAVKGLIRKGLISVAGKALRNRAVRTGIKGAAGVVGTTAGGATMAPFSNVTYRNYADRTNDQFDVQMDDMGNFIAEKTRPTSKLERGYKAGMSGTIELGSELLGGELGRITLGKLLPKAVTERLGQTKVGEVVEWFHRKMGDTPAARRFDTYMGDTVKFYGCPMEVATEEYNSMMEPLLTGEPERLKENFSSEAQWDLILAVTSMSAGFGMLRVPVAVKDHISHRRESSARLKVVTDPGLRQELSTAMSAQTRSKQAQRLSSIEWKDASMSDQAAAMDYVEHRAQGVVTKEIAEARQEQELARRRRDYFNGLANKDTGNLERVTDTEGNEYFLAGGSLEEQGADGVVFVRDPQTGEVSQRNVNDLKRDRSQSFEEYEHFFQREGEMQSAAAAAAEEIQAIREEAEETGVDPTPAIATYRGIDLDNLAEQTVSLADGMQVFVNQVVTKNGKILIEALPLDESGEIAVGENGEELHMALDVADITAVEGQPVGQSQEPPTDGVQTGQIVTLRDGSQYMAIVNLDDQGRVQILGVNANEASAAGEERIALNRADIVAIDGTPMGPQSGTMNAAPTEREAVATEQPTPDPYEGIEPMGTGAFGNIYPQFRGKAQEAIDFLMQRKEGEAIGALNHPQVGDIDLVWGSDKAGLQKIAQKHPEMMNNIQGKIEQMQVVQSSDNRIVLEGTTYKAIISKMLGQEKTPQWLLTAYEKKESSASASSSDIETEPEGERNGTATPQNGTSEERNILHSKDTNSAPNTQEKAAEEIPRRKDGTPDYDQITDPSIVATALHSEFGEEALPVARESLAEAREKLKRAGKIKNAIERKRTQMNASKEITKWEQALVVLNPAPTAPKQAEKKAASQSRNQRTTLRQQSRDLGDYLSLEDKILRDIAEGQKFRWTGNGSQRGLATELGFTDSPGERKARFNILANGGITVDQYAERLEHDMDSGAIPFDWDTDVRSAVLDVLSRVRSNREAFDAAAALREPDPRSTMTGDEARQQAQYDDARREGTAVANEAKTEFIENDVPFMRLAGESSDVAEEEHRHAVEAIVEELNHKTDENVFVFSKIEELPAAIRDKVQKTLDAGYAVQGLTWNDSCYLHAPTLLDATTIEQVYTHELAGHRNIEALFPDKTSFFEWCSRAVDDIGITEMMERIGNSDFTDYIDAYFAEPNSRNKYALGREYLAYLAENERIEELYSAEYTDIFSVPSLQELITTETLVNLIHYANSRQGRSFSESQSHVGRTAEKEADYRRTNRNERFDQSGITPIPPGDRAENSSGSGSDRVSRSGDSNILSSAIGDVSGRTSTAESGTFVGGSSQTGDAEYQGTVSKQNSARTDRTEQGTVPTGETVTEDTEADNTRYRAAYHGSPHDFEQFDHAFMGTGEGAQAFGWGTYVTEVNGIARSYAEQKRGRIRYKDMSVKEIEQLYQEGVPPYSIVLSVIGKMEIGYSFAEARTELEADWRSALEYDEKEANEELAAGWEENLAELASLSEEDFMITPLRNLYTVEIPDDGGGNYLRWKDDLLDTERERIVYALSKVNTDTFDYDYFLDKLEQYEDTQNLTGEGLYKLLSKYGFDQNDQKASEALSQIGFAGIEYPAQSTLGGRADGAKNYVIFNDQDVQITDHIRFRNMAEANAAQLSPEEVNARFNEQLQQQIEGTLPKSHIYQLGMPSVALKAAGVPDLPIELSADRLSEKASTEYASGHPFELSEIENLPQALANPIAVFDSRKGEHSKVVLTELESKGNNFVAILRVQRKGPGWTEVEINDVRSLYPKDRVGGLVDWINNGLLRWVDKEKAARFLLVQGPNYLGNGANLSGHTVDETTQQRSDSADVDIPIKGIDSATNIIKNFANPTIIEGEKMATADVLAAELNVPIRVVKEVAEVANSETDARRKRRNAGWHSRATGEIAVVLPNCADVAEVQKTILHEAVGHYGIVQLLGQERADELYRRVFDSLDDDVQKPLLEKYGSKTVAGDEYLAEMAEGNVTPGAFRRMMAAVRAFFRDVLGVNLKMTDADMRYILWRSKHNLQNAKTVSEAMETIGADLRMRSRMDHESARERKAAQLEKLRLAEPVQLTPAEVNELFNDELNNLTPENANSTILWLGNPSEALRTAGVVDKPLKLYGNKVIKKMEKHGFALGDLKNLPQAVANPIAVFDNIGRNGNRSILTELQTPQGNVLVAIDLGKGQDVSFNIISSTFGKGKTNIIDWINKGFATYIDTKKALDYLHHPALIAETSNSQGLAENASSTQGPNYLGSGSDESINSATNIIKNFANPTLLDGEKVAAVDALATELKVAVRAIKDVAEIADSESDARRKRRNAGWHSRTTGEIAVVLPNCSDVAEVQKTILHEAVGHYGIPELLGQERADELYRRVFDSLDDDVQKPLLEKYGSKTVAGDEYLAEMAEGNVTPGAFRRMMAAVRAFFRDVLGIDLKLTDADMRYILWRSKHNLQNTKTVSEAMQVIGDDLRMRKQMDYESAKERKTVQLEKLRQAEPLIFTGDEYKGKYELNNQSAANYINNELRGEYINKDTGTPIRITRKGAFKVTRHDAENNIHIQSVAYIPQMIEQAVYIDESVNQKSKADFESYRYYVCGLKIGGVDYTAKLVIGKKNGETYYDHALTEIEKTDLIERRDEISSSFTDNEAASTGIKDKRLFSILQPEPLAYQADASEQVAKNKPKTITEYLDQVKLPDEDLRFREKPEPKPNDPIVTTKDNFASKFRTRLVDDLERVRQLQDYIKKHSGRVDIDTDVWAALNRAYGRIKAGIDKVDPYFDEIKRQERRIYQKYGFVHEEIEEYLAAKSSQERHASGIAAYAETSESPWNKQHVEDVISFFETKVPKAEVNDLWKLIRNLTQHQLELMKYYNLISVQTYRYLQARGWQYYLPLQGMDFDFENVTDPHEIFGKILSDRGSGVGSLLQKAEGRTLKAGDVLATLQRNIHLTIMAGEQNLAKHFLLRLVEANPELQGDTRSGKGIFEIEDRWLVRRDDKRITPEERERGELYDEVRQRPSNDEITQSREAQNQVRKLTKELNAVNSEIWSVDSETGDNDVLSELLENRLELQKQIEQAYRQVTVMRTPPSKHAYVGLSKGEDAKFEIPVYRNGVRVLVRLSDAKVAQAINGDYKGLFGGGAIKGVVDFIGSATRLKAALNTSLSPEFQAVNTTRDYIWALFYHSVDKDGHARSFMRNYPLAQQAIAKHHTGRANPLTINERAKYNIYTPQGTKSAMQEFGAGRVRDSYFDDFLMEGGLTGFAHMQSLDHYTKKISRGIRSTLVEDGNSYMKRLKNRAAKVSNSISTSTDNASQNIRDAVELFSDLSEISARFATFLAQAGAGADVRTAVDYARNISVNFNRRGEWGRELNSLYMFFTAATGGIDTFYQLGKRNKRNAAIATLIVAGMSYGAATLLAHMLAAGAAGDGDDEQWRVSDYVRHTNLCIPGWVIGSKDQVITIPLPQELRPAWVLGAVFSDLAQGRLAADDVPTTITKALGTVAESAGDSFLPVEFSVYDPVKAFVPSIFKEVYEISQNKDFMEQPIYREPYTISQEGRIPNSQLGMRNASKIATSLTEWLNELGGGSKSVPAGARSDGSVNTVINALFDWNPSKIDHLISSNAGGLGRMLFRTYRYCTSPEDELASRDIPFVNRFLKDVQKEVSPNTQYYDLKDKYQSLDYWFKKEMKEGRIPPMYSSKEEAQRKADEVNAVMVRIRSYDKTLSGMRKSLEQTEYGSDEYKRITKDMNRVKSDFIKEYDHALKN